MWPTWEQGTISSVPPHIHDLKDSSKFSPPQISKPESYKPSFSKNALSIANRPPAIVGECNASAGSWNDQNVGWCLYSYWKCISKPTLWRFFSRSGTACQLNCKFQSKPPTLTPVESRKWNSSVLSSITSITGQTTFVGLVAIRSNRGSSQPNLSSERV